jgi:hypothetical protein
LWLWSELASIAPDPPVEDRQKSAIFFLDIGPRVVNIDRAALLSLCPLEIRPMSLTIRTMLGLAASCVLFGATTVHGQDGPTPKPTPEHERLKHDVGVWDATIKAWMQGPQSEPAVSQGLETVRLMPGGFWILSEFEGKFGDSAFHGAGQSGYDPQKKKYVGTWVDSMSPSIMMMEGDFDPDSKTMTMYSKGTDPAGKPYDAKLTSIHKDENTRVFTMSMKSDETKGEYVKMMEITYTRRAK